LLSVTGIQSATPALAKLLSTSELSVSAQISTARGAGATARRSEIVSLVELRGRVDLNR